MPLTIIPGNKRNKIWPRPSGPRSSNGLRVTEGEEEQVEEQEEEEEVRDVKVEGERDHLA